MIADVHNDIDEVVLSSSEKENVDINGTNELSVRLQAVFNDMNGRFKEYDPDYVSGITKFTNLCRKNSTPIASALHTFD